MAERNEKRSQKLVIAWLVAERDGRAFGSNAQSREPRRRGWTLSPFLIFTPTGSPEG